MLKGGLSDAVINIDRLDKCIDVARLGPIKVAYLVLQLKSFEEVHKLLEVVLSEQLKSEALVFFNHE